MAYARNFLSSASLMTVLGLGLFLGTGCTTLKPELASPTVNVTSFRQLSAPSLAPQFEVGLHVANPNAIDLSLRGMSYKIWLNDYEVVQGTASDLPVVPAHGEAELKLIANVGLIEGMKFLNDMAKKGGTQIAYRVHADLDVGALYPMIRIEKTGSVAP